MAAEFENPDFLHIAGGDVPAENLLFQILALTETAFPEEERRAPAGQRFLFGQPEYHVLAAVKGAVLGGFLAWWQMDGFRYVEHFAVDPALRGGGLGGKMLDRFTAADRTPCVLEVEPPETEMARRRIAFYRRHGFETCPFAYMQLPLRPGGVETPLVLMATQTLQRPLFERVRDALYARVYTCGTDFA